MNFSNFYLFLAPLGFRTPQSDAYYSCTAGTDKELKSSPAASSSGASSSRLGTTMDIFRKIEKIGEGSYAVSKLVMFSFNFITKLKTK